MSTAACLGAHQNGDDHPWFPTRRRGSDSQGLRAKAVCRTCPLRPACLLGAVERNEQNGIWGGAGSAEIRYLRRAWVADGRRAGGTYATEAALFALRLERGRDAEAPDRNGPGAQHGHPSTYGRGCRCEPCVMGKAFGFAVRTLSITPEPRSVPA